MKHLIKLALVLLASVASYYVYEFTAMVADRWIALGAASSLVGTYVGLAFAEIPGEQRNRAQLVAWAAMLIEALYGTLWVLHRQSPELFVPPLPIGLSVALAVLHGASFSVLAFFVSLFVFHAQAKQAGPVVRTDTEAMLGICRDMLAEIRMERAAAHPFPEPAGEPKMYPCPKCEQPLTQAAYGAAQRWGRCYQCREQS